jgi:DNA-binding response OmpR family regulator
MSTISRPATIGICDPDTPAYESVLSELQGSDLTCCFLSTGNDALELARRWSVGLWLINSRLSDMSGFDLARRLRRSNAGVRVLIVGDDYSVDEELQTLSLGLVKYLVKPLDGDWLVRCAQPAISAARAYRSASAAVELPRSPSEAAFDELAPAECAEAGVEELPVILPFKRKQTHRRPAA